MSKDELTLHDMSTLLIKFWGLYRISGESNDMHELMTASAKRTSRRNWRLKFSAIASRITSAPTARR